MLFSSSVFMELRISRSMSAPVSIAMKLALLVAYDACDPGKKGEFARREGIYSSQLTEWRRARDAGTLPARESGAARRDRREFDKLEKKNKQLEAELERTRLALDIVGKAHALLEKLSESADNE